MMLKKEVIMVSMFLVFLHMASVAALPVITTVQESPSKVYYEDSITIRATVTSSDDVSKVTLLVDGIDYQMTETSTNQYTVSLHTIKNLAALGFAVYPYTITVIDSVGNTATSTGSIEIIASNVGDDQTLSASEIQNILDWVLLWI
jgi:hypothetical protein